MQYIVRNELRMHWNVTIFHMKQDNIIDYDKLNYIHIQINELWNTITTWAKQRYQAGQLVWWPNQPSDELLFSVLLN